MPRSRIALALFVAAYMIGFTAQAVVQGNSEFLFYAAVMVLLIGLVLAMHRRVRFSEGVLWGLAVWGLLHMAGGNVRIPASLAPDWHGRGNTVLYNLRLFRWMPRYDQIVHAYGFAVATLASYQALRAAAGGALRVSPGVALALVCMGMGLGALNEVVEFVATLMMETNVGGFVNTGWDLVSNLIGCLAAAAWLWWSGRRRPA